MTDFDPYRPVSMTKPLPPGPGVSATTAALPAPTYAPVPYGPPPVVGPPATYGLQPVAYPTVVMPQQSNAEIVVAWVVTVITGLYMLPWAVAATRRSTNSVLIAVATFFLAWTVLGWFALLLLSFLGPTVYTVRPVVAFAPVALPAPPPAGVWAHNPADPPHVRRWWDGRDWTAHTTIV